jgi:Flp pilus assembly protein TadD
VVGNDAVHEASVLWTSARSAIVAGHLDDANLLMCQAVALNPESAALEGLAQHYLRQGSYKNALLWADRVEAIRPGQMEMGNLRGDLFAFMGQIDKAREVWLKTLNIAPTELARMAPISKDYSIEAGRHLRRGDLAQAEVFFRRAIGLDSENLTAMIGLAKVYQRLTRTAQARAFCLMALTVSSEIPEVHVQLGELALAAGDMVEAKSRFESALAVRPDFFPAKRGLAQVN